MVNFLLKVLESKVILTLVYFVLINALGFVISISSFAFASMLSGSQGVGLFVAAWSISIASVFVYHAYQRTKQH